MKSIKWGGTNYHRAITSLGIFVSAFMLTMFVASAFAPANLSNAETVHVALNPTGYFLDFTSSQDLDIELNTTPTGVISAVKDTLNTRTNVPTGYKLYVSMANNDTNGNRMYLNGLAGGTYIAPTGHDVTAPAALDMNSWGFAVPSDAEGASNNFATASNYTTPKPGSNATFATMPLNSGAYKIQEISTPDETDGTDLDIYYAVKANTSQTAGAYQAEITYSIISDGTISGGDSATMSPSTTYNLNGGDTATITTSLTTSDTDFGTITVDVGGTACANPVGSIDPNTSALIITCTLPAHSTGDYSVTVWLDKYEKMYVITDAIEYTAKVWELQELTYMQNMTPSICSSIATPTTGLGTAVPTASLIDTRDDKTYTVAKLKDGNCWMITPLRLGSYGSSITLTPEDSNVQSNYTINSSDIINAAGPNWNSTPGANHVFDRNNVTYGNWYNWYTATAGTGTPAMTDSDATSSICPKGWKLPSYIGADSFQNLVNTYSATSFAAIQNTPLVFLPAGGYSSGTVYDVGTGGVYWSASATSTASNAYFLGFYSGGVSPQDSVSKYYGFSVRCVAER